MMAPNATAATASDDATGTTHPALRQALRTLIEAGGPALYARIEREAVLAAYEVCHRNQVHTAALMGITRNVLRTQLKRFGLLPERPVRRAAACEAPRAASPQQPPQTHTQTQPFATGDLTPCAA